MAIHIRRGGGGWGETITGGKVGETLWEGDGGEDVI